MIVKVIKIAALVLIFTGLIGASAYLTLTLLIKGEDTVVVPDLAGRDVVYALEVISDLGFHIKVVGSDFSDRVPKNHVLSQDKPSGTEIKKGREVRITLSKGPRHIPMPNVRGLAQAQARIILEDNHICLARIAQVYHPRGKKGAILAQSPAAGSMIRRGTCADLLTSRGPRPRTFIMPSFAGDALEEVVRRTDQAGFAIGHLRYAQVPTKPENTVLNQSPKPGHLITDMQSIELVINRHREPSGNESDRRTADGRLFRYRVPDGFLKRKLRLRMNGFGISDDIIDRYFKPGEELLFLIPKDAHASLFLYEDGQLIRTAVFDKE